MAKSYIDIVKYMVEAKFEISGSVEKPDIIGAVFGQTEGLLGSDLDLRELQKNGKIGRIEIESGSSGNKTYGKLLLPSSLGRVETCILAAAIESVDRVGPFDTSFKIEKIEDTRNEKRTKVINRAKELVKNLIETVLPDSREISDLVEAEVKSDTVVTYGPDKLPAGPDIDKSDDVVIVEGRADVVNLLKNDVTNCVSIGGATGTIPKSVVDMCSKKEVTVFLDGDRGGDIILRSLTNVAEIDFVARAPDGKEVEELTRKEIIKALRSRVPYEQSRSNGQDRQQQQHFRNDRNARFEQQQAQRQDMRQGQYREQRGQQPQHTMQQAPQPEQRTAQQAYEEGVLSPSEISNRMERRAPEPREQMERPAAQRARGPEPLGITRIGSEGPERGTELEHVDFGQKPAQGQGAQPNATYVAALNELKNTLRGRLYSMDGTMLSEIPIRELMQTVQDTKGTYSIVFDGIVTQRLIELAYANGVREVYGTRASQISKKYPDLLVYTGERGVV
ncbi:MAG: DNA primase DnaG [Candidatus Marsarchaeota archaeon]|nr:DNA primase DnaG [Candidatus Marsarchaeota archaeon]